MAMSLNKITLIGHVGGTPTMREVGEQVVSEFSLATSDRKKSSSGEWVDDTTWHRLVCWGKSAETVLKYVKKGSLIYAEGKMRHRQYQDKQGQTRTASDVSVDRVLLLDKAPTATVEKALPTLDVSQSALKKQAAMASDDLDTDIPF